MPKKRTLYLSIAELKELGLIKKYLRKKRKNKKKKSKMDKAYQGYNGIKSVSDMVSSSNPYNQINRNNDLDNQYKIKLIENLESQNTNEKQILQNNLENFNKFQNVFGDYVNETDKKFLLAGEQFENMNKRFEDYQIVKPYTLERNQEGDYFTMPNGDIYNSESGIKFDGVNLLDSQDTPPSSNSETFLREGEVNPQISISSRGINFETPFNQSLPTTPLQQPNDDIIAEPIDYKPLFESLKAQALNLAQGDDRQIELIEKLKLPSKRHIIILKNKIKKLKK